MPGYLDGYGVADQRRERIVKRFFLWGGTALIVAVVGYYGLRTYPQQRVVDHFLSKLGQQQYQDAYKMWCPQNCRLYSPNQFLEDWGPTSKYAKTSDWKIQHVDFCGEGVVFDMSYPGTEEDVGLWVNRSTGLISFTPSDTPRCPGRHMHLGAFLKSLFS